TLNYYLLIIFCVATPLSDDILRRYTPVDRSAIDNVVLLASAISKCFTIRPFISVITALLKLVSAEIVISLDEGLGNIFKPASSLSFTPAVPAVTENVANNSIPALVGV